MDIAFRKGDLTTTEQSVVANGFSEHTESSGAPAYAKERFTWLAKRERHEVLGALTADALWDWLYIDELWVSPQTRGRGLGRELMQRAEDFAASEEFQGVWLWTQSWQAAGFYENLDYLEFARFEDFPKGHFRIGYRKLVSSSTSV